ncbi:MAG: transcriptional regulator, partial [Rhodobacteraceae bacterium CG17_big_fil_post_rev_8_21_14_2_50_65_11]
LHDSIGYHATFAARLVERRVEDGLRDFGLTRVGWCILLAVAEEGLRNPSDIARFVGIDRTATSRALRTLENEGLVSRAIGQEDRRTTEVTMTAAGYDRMFQVVPICRENMKHFNAKLTEAERAELKRLLIKLCHGQAGES